MHFSGNVSYTRGRTPAQNQLTLTLTGGFPDEPSTYKGTTSFSVINSDQINLPQFTAVRSDSREVQVYAMTLKRSGSRYLAEFEVDDGILNTSWRDATKWVLEINDTNDSDADGIPDFSDSVVIAPIISVHPQSQSISAGGKVILSVVATGDPPPSYQWQFNGANLPTATTASLALDNVQPAHAGRYRAVVSNTGGSVTSSEASLSVLSNPLLNVSLGTDRKARITWPSSYSNYALEMKSGITVFRWTTITTGIVVADGQRIFQPTTDLKQALFRLRRTP